MVAVLHPCSHAKKPLLILYWERGKKKKTNTQKPLGQRGRGKQTRDRRPALLSSLKKGMYNHQPGTNSNTFLHWELEF